MRNISIACSNGEGLIQMKSREPTWLTSLGLAFLHIGFGCRCHISKVTTGSSKHVLQSLSLVVENWKALLNNLNKNHYNLFSLIAKKTCVKLSIFSFFFSALLRYVMYNIVQV